LKPLDYSSEPPRPGRRLEGSADPIWWGVAGLLSMGSLLLPQLFSLRPDETTRLVIVESALFFSGALLGCIRPQRAWRWAAASFFALAVQDFVILASLPSFSKMDSRHVALWVVGRSSLYFLYAVPVLAGSYLGAYISSAGLD